MSCSILQAGMGAAWDRVHRLVHRSHCIFIFMTTVAAVHTKMGHEQFNQLPDYKQIEGLM